VIEVTVPAPGAAAPTVKVSAVALPLTLPIEVVPPAADSAMVPGCAW